MSKKYEPGEPITVDRLFQLAEERKYVYIMRLNRVKLAQVVMNMPFASVTLLLKSQHIREATPIKYEQQNSGTEASDDGQ
jgi:hypothetical protein